MGLTPIASLSPFEHPNGESGDSRLPAAIQDCKRRHPSRKPTRCRHAHPYFFGLAAAPRLGRRPALTVPLLPPPQKQVSPPSDPRPETPTPASLAIFPRTSP